MALTLIPGVGAFYLWALYYTCFIRFLDFSEALWGVCTLGAAGRYSPDLFTFSPLRHFFRVESPLHFRAIIEN